MDLSALPTDVREAARVHANGEVSWPDRDAASAIEALTAAGHRVLGLDIRFYAGDGTFYEIPWSSSSDDDRNKAEATALEALSRIDDLEQPGDTVERLVLVTWD
jgi:hypothetical protein